MCIYLSESLYISEASAAIDRINRLDQIILALENQAIVAASDSNITDYSLNDGQITIRTAYRSPDAIASAILAFEKIKTRLINKYSGHRIISLRDASSFNNLRNL